jgi:hypothetical protein
MLNAVPGNIFDGTGTAVLAGAAYNPLKPRVFKYKQQIIGTTGVVGPYTVTFDSAFSFGLHGILISTNSTDTFNTGVGTEGPYTLSGFKIRFFVAVGIPVWITYLAIGQ